MSSEMALKLSRSRLATNEGACCGTVSVDAVSWPTEATLLTEPRLCSSNFRRCMKDRFLVLAWAKPGVIAGPGCTNTADILLRTFSSKTSGGLVLEGGSTEGMAVGRPVSTWRRLLSGSSKSVLNSEKATRKLTCYGSDKGSRKAYIGLDSGTKCRFLSSVALKEPRTSSLRGGAGATAGSCNSADSSRYR